jgi:hypothetical protein
MKALVAGGRFRDLLELAAQSLNLLSIFFGEN